MSMQFRIVHTTTFTYDGAAVASYNQARLSPLTTLDQIVVHHRIDVAPKPWTYEYKDYFGNEVTAIEVIEPHQVLKVSATSTVQVDRKPGAAPVLTWEETAQPGVADRFVEFLGLPELVAPDEELAARVKAIAAAAAVPGEAAVEIARAIADTASPDSAHRLLGALRTVGIPARYVSGYVYPGGAHAWVEWWDDGWHGIDPATGTEPDDAYVGVATGRDQTDVKPLGGIYSGPAEPTVDVTVEMTRLA
ncbi:transglutaminase-like putative cysteine protease [Nocardioides luteus]|uniref:Transglutaminase-like protein n=1 Tax=Nocardioides luteus TaxID=1844 RepID=A0ABQ5SRP1_9ACTN|nr:transglutaminase N-terminal domain-containing protein [Nocardioides luteus]MDR7311274.1 transglutaminase-like putative cysteine protease [Nocardioides luteus]GGR70957.1 transglutaminase-like protein [Nocardioides luteus]GLJ66822.1 transglutaminase-like protein [Nocardioides luteus]